MAHKLEVELTSTRDDGTWTWRAAGARQPKGVLDGTLLWDGATVGDTCKVEADFHVDGIEVLNVTPPKQKQARTDLLQLKSRPLRDDELVTTQRSKGGRRGDRKGGRSEGRGGNRGDARRGGNRGDGPRSQGSDRPRPKRLRVARAHRSAVLAEVPEEFKPIAEQLQRGGIPAVREAIEAQNKEAKENGTPEIDPKPIMKVAEDLNPKLRAAEWRDRADAAIKDKDDVDLRDLRSVVASADAATRDPEARAAADELREALNSRVEAEHAKWSADLEAAVIDGRTVRALRLSGRPVKAGSPLPGDTGQMLVDQTAAAMTADTAPERWATVLDALAFSPVRNAVTPESLPTEPNETILEAVKAVADRVPAIAELFGIDPGSVPKRRRRGARPQRKGGGAKVPPPPDRDAAEGAAKDTPAEAAPVEAVAEAAPEAEPTESAD